MNLITLSIVIASFVGFLSFVFARLPDASSYPLPETISHALYIMYHSLAAMDYLLPVALIMSLFGLTILYDISRWFWMLTRWIIGLVRGSKS